MLPILHNILISLSTEAILLLFRCLLCFLSLISYFCSCSRGLKLTMRKVLLFLETKQKRYRSQPLNPFCFLFDCWRNSYKLNSHLSTFLVRKGPAIGNILIEAICTKWVISHITQNNGCHTEGRMSCRD